MAVHIYVIIFTGTFCLCNSLVQDDYFLASISDPFDASYKDTIHRVSVDFSNSTELALGPQKALHVNYDPKNDLVYWVDEKNISRGYSDGRFTTANSCFSEVVLENIQDGKLDIDIANRQLYWGSSYSGELGVADMDGSNSRLLYDEHNGAKSISDIRVDASEGIIFWSASGSAGRVARGSIHGGNHTLLHNADVAAIEINATAGVVYWITFLSPGSPPGTIQSSDYNGGNLDTNFLTVPVIGAIDMLLYDGYFYITTLNFNPGPDVKVYRAQEMKGAPATALEFALPVTYLSGPFGSTVSDATVISLVESQITGTEGELLTITILRTGNLFRCSSIKVTTVDGSATNGDDYESISTVLDFPARQPTMTFDLALFDDGDIEADETLSVILSEPVEGELGLITSVSVVIKDNEVVVYNFNPITYSATESQGSVSVTIERSGNGTYVEAAQITLSTQPDTAMPGDDYVAMETVVTFPAFSTSHTAMIEILPDNEIEGNETFTVTLSQPSHGNVGDNGEAIVTIMDACPEEHCQNNGTCIISGTRFDCICQDGFTGARCIGSEKKLTTGQRIGIAFGVAGFILIIVLIAAYILYRYKLRRVDNKDNVKDVRYSSKDTSVATYYPPPHTTPINE